MKRTLAALLTLLLAGQALATEVTLIAVMGNKGIFSINGQRKTLSPGQSVDGLRVQSISSDAATILIDGSSKTLLLGQGYVSTASSGSGSGGNTLTLSPDASGHYWTTFSINGRSVRGLVDTGATTLAMSASLAAQLGLNTKGGRTGRAQTANGVVSMAIIKVPELRLGDVPLYDVTVAVAEGNALDTPLIGMSVLNRFHIKSDNGMMLLTKKNF